MSGPLARRWPLLAVAGAVVVALLAMVSVRSPGAGLPPEPGAEIALADGDVVRWGLTTERAGLAALRLWPARGAPAGAELVVTIAPANNPTVTLAEAVVPLDGVGESVEARFAPVWLRASPHDPGAALVVQISPRGLAPGTELAVLAGADPSGRAPAFTPYYSERPLDRVLPITAMAEGRSGPLGMPSLYALLAYGFLVALLRALWLTVRAGEAKETQPGH
jgi:hypothetical protein